MKKSSRKSYYNISADVYDFFKDGLIYFPIKTDLKTITQKLNTLAFHEKYYGSMDADLDFDAYKFLWNHFPLEEVIQKAQHLSGRSDLYIGDIALRKVLPKSKPYLNWHRDTWVYTKNTNGRIPPLIKVIFYFSNSQDLTEKSIVFSKGSNRRFITKNRIVDLGLNSLLSRVTIGGKNYCDCVIFSSEICHKVIPPLKNEAFRLIMNLCSKEQLEGFERDSNLDIFIDKHNSEVIQEKEII